MKLQLLHTTALLAAASIAFAQSPAATASANVGGKTVTIAYSSPQVNGRAGKLFGKDGRIGQDRNYPVWRAGANTSTKLTTSGDLDIGGLTVPKGEYTLYVDLSDPDNWQLIVNKQTGQWGLTYNKAQDLGRVKMSMSKPAAMVEGLKYTIAGGKLTLEWENKSASVAVK
ncbi:MAG: DUF2911 domain-containing protein [Candidatus Solibacter usitatus]|nr:DUF2911 domain-containing protein [Candidatus Solibacter usitatus]